MSKHKEEFGTGAILLSALQNVGTRAGLQLFQTASTLVWALIASLSIGEGHWGVVLQRQMSGGLLTIVALVLVLPCVWLHVMRWREVRPMAQRNANDAASP